ncbi:MAG: PAS domain-containing sensor histidine kinase [Victivallaceae bacterium]
MTLFSILKPTKFASAERLSAEDIKQQADVFKTDKKAYAVLDMMPDGVLILNSERQAIYANKALLSFLNCETDESILGLRPGEIVDCFNAKNETGGCGTTEFCRSCGAVNAILATQKCHLEDKRECEIITLNDTAYNFRVWTYPFEKDGATYTLFAIRDIADEKYRCILERIFFHDLTNIGAGLYGLLNMIDGNSDMYQEHHQLLINLAEEILEEISVQRDIMAAENGAMSVNWEKVNSLKCIKSVVETYRKHQVAEGKNIQITTTEETWFKTDGRLLKRILGNMLKNAFEASTQGQTVTIKSTVSGNKIIFEVHNESVIPIEFQAKIFKRSVSTKGKGRGLGTYSIKLLSENYLQGKASFLSTLENGTSFFTEYPLEPTEETEK